MLFILLAFFLALAVGCFAVFAAFDERSGRARLLRDRLASVEQAQRRNPAEELELLRDELLSEIPALNKALSRSARVTRLQRYLAQADMKMRAGKFLLIDACVIAVGAVSMYLLAGNIFMMLLGGAIGCALPFGYAAFLRMKRFHLFEQNFPAAIDLLARAIRAGHAFTTALELMATELQEPLSGEFRKVFEEQKFGLPLRDALLNLTERIPLMDVKFFVTAVLLQRETGGNLAEILDNLSYLIRERFKILRQLRVYTAQGRLTMVILMIMPPACVLMLFLVNREFIRPMFTDPIGHLLIGAGIIMQTIGFLLIRKIIQIRV
ncbi:MAG TPA: type II secretion system F family protein [Clostridia bacterium]|nr:type II secretion system F family protein [Clostridia bacterium]